jgi:hypothetical protein
VDLCGEIVALNLEASATIVGTKSTKMGKEGQLLALPIRDKIHLVKKGIAF